MDVLLSESIYTRPYPGPNCRCVVGWSLKHTAGELKGWLILPYFRRGEPIKPKQNTIAKF